MANTIVSLFDNLSDAQTVASELTNQGITRSNINIIEKDNGNISSTLQSASVPADAARIYEEGVRRGGTLLTARVDDNQIDTAMDIINRHGAIDINERTAQYQTRNSNDRYINRDASQGEYALPIVEEELQVGKRAVQRGGVRVYTHITERPVEETVRLREEHVNVERRPVDRPVADADLAAFKEGAIEVTETAEVPVVAKQARVVEEVIVSKEVAERSETVRDTVRRTDVEVEQLETDRAKRTSGGK